MNGQLTIVTKSNQNIVDNVHFDLDILKGEMEFKGKNIDFEFDSEVATEIKNNRKATVSIATKIINGKVAVNRFNMSWLVLNLIK